MIMKAKTNENRPLVCLSDGKFITEKCALSPELGNKFLVQKLNNSVVKILQWNLKDALSFEGHRTVLVIQNLVVVKNHPNFPILGNPYPLHRMKTATTATIAKSSNHAPPVNSAILTWKSIICFLNEANVNVATALDNKILKEVICKQIIAKTEPITEPTPQGWRYLCTDCNLYKCRHLSQIVNHIQLSHLQQFPGYKCPHCSLMFPAFLSFENHIKDDHFHNTKSKFNPPKKIQISSSPPAAMIANSQIKGISDLAAGILSSMDTHFMLPPGLGPGQWSEMISGASPANIGSEREKVAQPTPRMIALPGQQILLK